MSKKSYNIIKNCIVCPECKFGCISNEKIIINCDTFEKCKCGNIALKTSSMYGTYHYDLFFSYYLNNSHMPGLRIIISTNEEAKSYFIYSNKIRSNYSALKDNYLIFNDLINLKYKDNFNIKSKDINDFVKQFQIFIDDIFKIKENLLFI